MSSDGGVNRDNAFSNSAIDVDKILSQIISDYPDALDDRKQLKALLTDLIPQEKLVRNTLLMAFDEGIVSNLKETKVTDKLTFHRYSKILIDNYGISDSLAEQSIRIRNNSLTNFLEK